MPEDTAYILAMLDELVREVADTELRDEFRRLFGKLAMAMGVDDSRKVVAK